MQVFEEKQRANIPIYVPEREQELLNELIAHNTGPFSNDTIRYLFHEILRASTDIMEAQQSKCLQVSRATHAEDLVIPFADVALGAAPSIIAGPCAIESEGQLDAVGACLRRHGIRFLRGGAFKPRTSPYAFQGLGKLGLELMKEIGRRHGLVTISEVTDTRLVELVAEHVDVLQIGSRNMFNYDLLMEAGKTGKPVLLKRGLCATIEEYLQAAEYVVLQGNRQVVLCERGIRTYERSTRNTLDISSVPLLRQMSYLPVIVDVSHAAGRKDILAPLGRAALAAGANGLMVEIHPFPATARSDSRQQLDFTEFEAFLKELAWPWAAVDSDLHFPAHAVNVIEKGRRDEVFGSL